ncbi:MAG TPA: SLBB domain-containing protein [Ignavibacteriaceae bacterium]|nr:SLBB domain-containing protein [Ignavibacteriaceae bacterium]
MKRKLFISFLILFSFVTYSQDKNNSTNFNSLLSSASISVTIGGEFPITGTFPASINERVDQFITRMYLSAHEKAMNNITDPELLNRINEKLNKYSLRNITLKRSSGEKINIDLLKFRLNGNFKNNPYLKNDDVIIFPPVDLERNFFSISGAVNNPGKFPFVEGDKLSDAIELAQGISKAYNNVTSAEINRLDYNGENLNRQIIDINSDFSLKRGDRIKILAVETQKKDFNVTIIGEVNQPGKISISKSNTTLKEVIKNAGGLTDKASLKRARLFSGENILPIIEKEFGIKLIENEKYEQKDFEEKYLKFENMLMSRMSNITEQDTSYFLMENQIRLTEGGGAIDFTKLLDENSQASNFIVRNGDVIIIPQKEDVIYVFGQVAHPGKINFIKNEDYKYYIKQAGGFSDYSDEDVMIIKSASREWISVYDENAKIEEGDYLYIPKDPKRSFHYYLSETASYLSIIGSIATIILLLIQINK